MGKVKGMVQEPDGLSVDAVRRLLHELQAHRSELQRQKAELRRVRDEAEAAAKKFADFHDNAPVGYMTLDRDGMIHSLNMTGAGLFGKERSGLLARRFGLFVAAAGRPVFDQFLTNVFSSPGTATCEVCIERTLRPPLPVQITAVAVANAAECRAVIIDISKRKMMEEELHESQRMFKSLADNSPDIIARFDRQFRHLYVTPRVEKVTGMAAAEFIGRTNEELGMPEELCQQWNALCRGVFASGEEQSSEFVFPSVEGPVYYHLRLVPEFAPDGAVATVMSVVRDVSEYKQLGEQLAEFNANLEMLERKRAEELSLSTMNLQQEAALHARRDLELRDSRERLRNLSTYLQYVREEERKSVAREIHDELGQSLATIQMGLELLLGGRFDRRKIIDSITDMKRLVADGITTVQRISAELRPQMLDVLGLADALAWQGEEFQKRTGIICKVTILLMENNVHPEVATALFRIFQESLTNVQRHSGATNVEALLVERGPNYGLMVRDNGKGISREEIASPQSIGLIGMRERLFTLGGRIKIRGAPQKGTVLFVRVPVNPKENVYVHHQQNYHR